MFRRSHHLEQKAILTPADPKTFDNYFLIYLRIFIVYVISVLNKEIKLN